MIPRKHTIIMIFLHAIPCDDIVNVKSSSVNKSWMSNSLCGAERLWLEYKRSGKSGPYSVFIRLLAGIGSVSL